MQNIIKFHFEAGGGGTRFGVEFDSRRIFYTSLSPPQVALHLYQKGLFHVWANLSSERLIRQLRQYSYFYLAFMPLAYMNLFDDPPICFLP